MNNNKMTLGEFLKECYAKKGWFMISVFVMIVLAVAYLVVTPPKYTKKAQVMVRDNNALSGLMGQMGGLAV